MYEVQTKSLFGMEFPTIVYTYNVMHTNFENTNRLHITAQLIYMYGTMYIVQLLYMFHYGHK
jgi:hypothetical protein